MTPEQEVASRIAGALLGQAISAAARALAERIRGSARERSFGAAVGAAVGRFLERYPAAAPVALESDFLTDPQVVDRLFRLVMDDDAEALSWLATEFRRTYDDQTMFAKTVENALMEFVELLEEEMTETGIIGRRDLKHFRRIEAMIRAAQTERTPLGPADAVEQARILRDRIQLSVGDAMTTRIVVDEDVATVQLVPRSGKVVRIQGSVTFRFPNDPDGVAAREAWLRAIETGTEATIPRRYIAAAALTVDGKAIPGTERLPDQVTLRAGPANPFASRITLYHLGRLLASIEIPHLLRIRAGTREALFETQPGRAIDVSLTLRLPPVSTVSANFEIHFDRVHDAHEGWPLMRFLLCAPSADQVVWELLGTGQRLAVNRPSTPAAPPASRRYLAHLRALADIQAATGFTMAWPWKGATRGEIRHSLRIARAVRAGGLVKIYDPFDIEVSQPADLSSITRDANEAGEVSLNVLVPDNSTQVGGTRVDLGPVFIWYPTVRVEDYGAYLRIRPGSDPRAFEAFVNYGVFEILEPARHQKVIFSEPNAFPLAMLGLRRRETHRPHR